MVSLIKCTYVSDGEVKSWRSKNDEYLRKFGDKVLFEKNIEYGLVKDGSRLMPKVEKVKMAG